MGLKCIFCKQESSNAKSVEHIIPETLGNKTFVLSQGMVCDQCNNYFSRKIEQPFFELEEIKRLRFYQGIPNKRGKIPSIEATMNGNKINITRMFANSSFPAKTEVLSIDGNIEEGNMLLEPYTDGELLKTSRIISRFIAKIAFESFAGKITNDLEWLDYIINNNQLDNMRNYVRFNIGQTWPYKVRRIYNVESTHYFSSNEPYQIIHESDFLLIKEDLHSDKITDDSIYAHIYFVVALWGLEFVINLTDSSEDGFYRYEEWLNAHNNKSFLHYGKNDTSILCGGTEHE